MQTLDIVDAASLRSDIPAFGPGDTVKVHVNIVEGSRSRVQVFQGVVLGRSGDGVRETFTVRKISFQVGVERTFPVHSPIIDKIELVNQLKCVGCGAMQPGTAFSNRQKKATAARRLCKACVKVKKDANPW